MSKARLFIHKKPSFFIWPAYCVWSACRRLQISALLERFYFEGIHHLFLSGTKIADVSFHKRGKWLGLITYVLEVELYLWQLVDISEYDYLFGG